MFVDPVIRTIGISLGVFIITDGNPTMKKLSTGVYQINHFSFDFLISKDGGNLRDDDEWSDMLWNEDDYPFHASYGVCDGFDQFLRTDLGKQIVASPSGFCMSLTRVAKATQGEGGWRWHTGAGTSGVHISASTSQRWNISPTSRRSTRSGCSTSS